MTKPLPLKAMIAALTATIPGSSAVSAQPVPFPRVAPSFFAAAASNAVRTTYSKDHFLLKDSPLMGQDTVSTSTKKSKKKKKSTGTTSTTKPQTAR